MRSDKDRNGSITKEEWDAVIKNTNFSKADENGDGVFTASDFEIVNKKWIDAVDNEDFQVLNDWGKASAGVVLPNDWFKDHFAHSGWQPLLTVYSLTISLARVGDRNVIATDAT